MTYETLVLMKYAFMAGMVIGAFIGCCAMVIAFNKAFKKND